MRGRAGVFCAILDCALGISPVTSSSGVKSSAESGAGACRGLETGLDGWSLPKDYEPLPKDQLLYKLRTPNPERFTILKQARPPQPIHCSTARYPYMELFETFMTICGMADTTIPLPPTNSHKCLE